MILALDPSSTCVGYALLSSAAVSGLCDGGLLTPKPRKLEYLARVQQLAGEVRDLIKDLVPDRILLELPSPHVNHHRHGGAGQGLATYGLAVGYILYAAEASGVPVEPVPATTWTQEVSKQKRTATIAAIYGRRYDRARDPGGDLADAIGLGRWYLQERQFMEKVQRARAQEART